MKTQTMVAAIGTLSIALAACSGAENTSDTDATQTVEEPAEAALKAISEDPVEDEAVETLEEVQAPPAVSDAEATNAANEAARDLEEVEAALADLDGELGDTLDDAVETAAQVEEVQKPAPDITDKPGG